MRRFKWLYPMITAPLSLSLVVVLAVLAAGPSTAQTLPTWTDQTTAAGLDDARRSYPDDIISPLGFFDSFVRSCVGGGAAGDFNNDGWQDLFFLSFGVEPNRLYINNGDGTFTDQAAAWGVDEVHLGSGAAVGDYDGDGHLDIYVTSFGEPVQFPIINIGSHVLYRNNGDGTFSEADAGVNLTSPFAASGMGSSFADYDLDGDLDLVVTGWVGIFQPTNFLFRNDGGVFTNVTGDPTANPTVDFPLVRGFGPRLVDMFGAGVPDILLVADFQASRYYRLQDNGDGTSSYVDVTAAMGTSQESNGMGSTVNDFNNDGLLDWYVTSIFDPDSTGQVREGNKLYINTGDPNPPAGSTAFLEVAALAGVDDGGWGWGTVGLDVDHDGRVDIVEGNGWDDRVFPFPEFVVEQMYYFHNEGNDADGLPIFSNVDPAISGLDEFGQTRGLVHFDYDNDGDLDIAAISNDEGLRLFRSEVAGRAGAGWLRIFLDTTGEAGLAPNGLGSRVVAEIDGGVTIRSVDGGQTFLAQGEMSAHFGLGSNEFVDRLAVEWADGRTTEAFMVPANQTLTISPSFRLGDLTGDGCVTGLDVAALQQSQGACAGCAGDLNGDGQVDQTDFDVQHANLGCADGLPPGQ